MTFDYMPSIPATTFIIHQQYPLLSWNFWTHTNQFYKKEANKKQFVCGNNGDFYNY
jgi:hypothetical protein